jgi:multiple antibiotic resistance protein
VLFLVALRPVLEQYAAHDARAEAAQAAATAEQPSKALAITPLAFPTIVTPYGVAVLILLIALGPNHTIGILAVAAAVLAVDLLAMLGADRILKTPFVGTLLLIVGMVLGILQVALGIQTAAEGVRLLGLMGAGAG